jgi:hypothetical protein
MSAENNVSDKIDRSFLKTKDELISCPNGHEILIRSFAKVGIFALCSVTTFPWEYAGGEVSGRIQVFKPLQLFEKGLEYQANCPHCMQKMGIIYF